MSQVSNPSLPAEESVPSHGRSTMYQVILDQLAILRNEQRQGFDSIRAEFNQRIDRLVTQDAFAAEQRRVDEKMHAVLEDLADERSARELGLANERKAREAGLQQSSNAIQRQTTLLRWLGASVVIPMAGLIIGLLSQYGGG